MLAPTFQKELVRRWSSTIVNYCEQMRDGWCDCQEIDVEYEMLWLRLAIGLKELLSVDLEGRTDEIARGANTLVEMIHCRTLPIIDDLLDKIALGRIRRFNNARAQFDAIVYRMIRERREAASPPQDLLATLLQVRDEQTGSGGRSAEEIRDAAVTT